MRSSIIATIATDALTAESGYVLLGVLDGVAYVHLAPTDAPRRIAFPSGDLTQGIPLADGEEAPEGAMVAVIESPRPSFASEAVTLYDPNPAPFRWADFADAHPDLAADLMAHQWAGE